MDRSSNLDVIINSIFAEYYMVGFRLRCSIINTYYLFLRLKAIKIRMKNERKRVSVCFR